MTELPRFSDIDPAQVIGQLTALLQRNREQISALLNDESRRSWSEFVAPMDAIDNVLHRYWSRISHLHSVCDSKELRAAYNEALQLLTEYSTELEQNVDLYQAYKKIRHDDDVALSPQLNAAQRHILDEGIRDFELSGIHLQGDAKLRYAGIQQSLSDLGARFEQNVMDATQAWHKHITQEQELSGIPANALSSAKEQARTRELDGWVFTLDAPVYLAIMMYSDNAELRREMYTAYCTRASDQGPQAGQFDNSEVINETLALRHELAVLLGFNSYADLSLASKMAESAAQVDDFLSDLGKRVRAQAVQDLEEVKQFAQEHYHVAELAVWDVAYYSEKLKQASYSISDEELRPYFPEPRVLAGLFDVAKQLFAIDINEVNGADVWHPSVRVFEIRSATAQTLAYFYVDLHARANKRGGAWMDDAQGRFRFIEATANGPMAVLQKPIAFLTCNFSGPVDGQPALFTHDDVVTLFHEFGHGLHHMLTEVEYLSAAGIHGVEWDAVELPSQFMENFCWDIGVLKQLSQHVDTGESLSDELITRMLRARHFQSAMQMLRQVEFSLFDLRLHAHYVAGQTNVMAELNRIRDALAVIVPPAFNRFPHSFSHIFAGGYAAGYYSYKWAEVLSADAFGRFEEDGLFNAATGTAFRQEILSVGGTRPALVSFRAFRGRDPDISALLRHNGIPVESPVLA